MPKLPYSQASFWDQAYASSKEVIEWGMEWKDLSPIHYVAPGQSYWLQKLTGHTKTKEWRDIVGPRSAPILIGMA